MKILLLGFTKIKLMPYMHFYLNMIDPDEHEVHVLYWDRDGKSDAKLDDRIHLHCFKSNIDDSVGLRKKLPHFLKYRKFAKKVLSEVNPERIIVHYQTTGILLYDRLTKKYKHKYILDYRDVTYERIAFFKKAVAKLVNRSYVTFTSSNGFRHFLPETERLLTSHNLTKSDLAFREDAISQRTPSDKIRISFWGMIRHFSLNKEIILKLGGDERFELHYYGRAQNEMMTLLKESEKKYGNVFFHGEYLSGDRYTFAKSTDLIHNIYDNGDATMPYAMANKFYDGPMFEIPQLCMKDSHMGNLCEEYGIGLACDPRNENFANDIFSYCQALDKIKLRENSQSFLRNVLDEIKEGEAVIKAFIKSEEKSQ